MRILKITEQIKDNMLIVSLPEEFNRKKVEVIIIPLKEKKIQIIGYNFHQHGRA